MRLLLIEPCLCPGTKSATGAPSLSPKNGRARGANKPKKQTFWNEFFTLFGIRRRVVRTFERAR